VVSFTPRPLYTVGKSPPVPNWIGGWLGPRAGLEAEAIEKNITAPDGK